MFDFQENEGDNRKLKKVQELVRHFRSNGDVMYQNKT